MTTLVFGRTGQVARELQALMAEDANWVFLGRDEADLSIAGRCREAILRFRPDLVINAAAYTAVDKAEEDEHLAIAINGEAPGEMARTAAEIGAAMLQLSTDYVFDGSGTDAWEPGSPTRPLSAYGRSKLMGEDAVIAAAPRHVVLRTSWVFSSHGTNFVKTIKRIAAEKSELNVVSDQIGGPTSARDIALALIDLAGMVRSQDRTGGVHHYAGAPDVSWADFARAIVRGAGLDTIVHDIDSTAMQRPAPRPHNSRLDCSSLQQAFGIERPAWQPALESVLEELGAK